MLENRVREIHVAMPGTVTRYDAADETVDVQPAFDRAVQSSADPSVSEFERLPILPSVPIAWPAGGGAYITFPLSPGDHVLLVFCERSISHWQDRGEVQTTGDQRPHPLSGAVAYPGIRPFSDKLGSGKVGSKLTIGPEVVLGATNATEPLLLGNQVKTWLDTHTHPSPFGPTSAPTTPLPTAALSTKHKAD